MKDVENLVIDLLVDVCATKKVKNDLNMDLIKNGYLDSMGIIELLTELEDKFEIEIPMKTFNLDDFSTAQKIINFVKNKIV